MDRQRYLYRVEDPRFEDWVWVAKGVWPDCPDCQGLLASKEGPTPRLFPWPGEEVIEPVEIPFPCPTCHDRTVKAGIEIPQHFWDRGPQAPYGTWPDCPDCKGAGGRWYSTGWDGHRSEQEFAHCQTCRARTHKFLHDNPTELDHLLRQQQDEAQPHIAKRQRLLGELRETESILSELSQKHNQELQEPTERMRQQLYSSRQRASTH